MLSLNLLYVSHPEPVGDGGAVARKEGQQVPVQQQRSPPHRSASVPVITPGSCGFAAGLVGQQQQQPEDAHEQQLDEEESMQQEGEPPAAPQPHAAAQAAQQLPSHDYECSICHDIIFNPVVSELTRSL